MNKLHTRSTEDLERTADYIAELQAEIDRITQALSLIERITISDEQIEDYVLRNTPVISQARAEAAIHWAVKQMRAGILEKIKPTK